MFTVKPSDYVNIGTYSVSGYYTLIVFSTDWCVPCKQVGLLAPGWLERNPDLVVVDIDIGAVKGRPVDPNNPLLELESSAIIHQFAAKEIPIPAALFVSQYCFYMNPGNGPDLAPPISGIDSIKEAVKDFGTRKPGKVLPFTSCNLSMLVKQR
jgi:hypothetical protein